MRQTILCGSLMVTFLLIMLPAVIATEARTVQTAKTPPYLLSISETDIKILREKYNYHPSPQTIILLTLGILLLKLLRWGAIFIVGGVLLIILMLLGKKQNTTGMTC